MDRPFLYCPACEEVGRDPGPSLSELPFEPADDLLDARTPDFRRRHAGHGLRALAVSVDAYVSEEAYGAGASLAFHQAVDGAGTRYVVEARREAPGQPVRFRLRRGALLRTREAITVDPSAIARVVAEAVGRPVDDEVLAAAARLAEVAAAGAREAGFAALEASAVAGPTPLVAHAPLPDSALPALFAEIRRLGGDEGLGSRNGRSLSADEVANLLELHVEPGGAFAPILETGYALLGPDGAVEGYVRRVAERGGRPRRQPRTFQVPHTTG